jgi:hypothetical protein
MEYITTIFPGPCCILNNDHEDLGYKLNLEDTPGVLYIRNRVRGIDARGPRKFKNSGSVVCSYRSDIVELERMPLNTSWRKFQYTLISFLVLNVAALLYLFCLFWKFRIICMHATTGNLNCHNQSPGIDSQPGVPVRKPNLLYRPGRLHRLAESIPGLLKRLQIRALCLQYYLAVYFF